MISFVFSVPVIILLSLTLVAILINLVLVCRPLTRTADEALRPCDVPQPEHEVRKVSLIVYIPGDNAEMENFLNVVGEQDYPDYEVICVREENAAAIKNSKEHFEKKYPGLYITFIPPGSMNLSQRKLAFTVGIKAAKGSIIVLTTPDARPESPHWISALTAPFDNPATRFSLGYASVPFHDMRGTDKWFRQFDRLVTDCSWISAAISGHPYRGDIANMAFTRDFFESTGGYRNFNFVHSGEDDIFVSQNATASNTAVVVCPDSRVSLPRPDEERRIWRRNKERYDFTARYCNPRPKRLSALSSALQWFITVCVAAVIALTLTGSPFTIPVASLVAVLELLAFWAFEITAYRRAAASLGAVRLWWAVPFFYLWRPVWNLLFGMKHRATRVKNYTWQRN